MRRAHLIGADNEHQLCRRAEFGLGYRSGYRTVSVQHGIAMHVDSTTDGGVFLGQADEGVIRIMVRLCI